MASSPMDMIVRQIFQIACNHIARAVREEGPHAAYEGRWLRLYRALEECFPEAVGPLKDPTP